MTTINSRQHYVPRFLLRAFGIPGRSGRRQQVWCFDKRTDQTFRAAIENVESEHAFFDIGGSQGVDRALSDLDDQMSKCHQVIVKAIAFFVAAQAMRTRAFRNTIIEASALDQSVAENPESSIEIRTSLGTPLGEEDHARLFQFHLIDRALHVFARALLQMKWVLLINNTVLPFWCSDDPYTYFNEFSYDPGDGHGFERPGSQTQLPLSHDLCLSIVDPRHFSDYQDDVIIDDIENVIFNNHLQVKNAERFVFSYNDDFGLVRQMISRMPGLRDPSRGRFDGLELERLTR